MVHMVENRNICRDLVGEREGNGLHGGSGQSWENNIKIQFM